MQAFPLPNSIIERIKRLCRNFLWARKQPKVAWDTICLPKTEGGLGLTNGRVWNKALLFKTFWNMHINKETLWIR